MSQTRDSLLHVIVICKVYLFANCVSILFTASFQFFICDFLHTAFHCLNFSLSHLLSLPTSTSGNQYYLQTSHWLGITHSQSVHNINVHKEPNCQQRTTLNSSLSIMKYVQITIIFNMTIYFFLFYSCFSFWSVGFRRNKLRLLVKVHTSSNKLWFSLIFPRTM